MKREDFLARVRTAQGSAVLPVARPGPLYPTERRKKPVQWFIESATAIGAVIHRASSGDEVRGLIRTIARETDVSVFTAWAESELPVPGVASYLGLGGMEEVTIDLPAEEGRTAATEELGRIGLGVTGADAAFARSGTIALWSGPGRSRMASLVPEVHVAVLDTDLVFPSLSEWAATHPDALQRASNLVFIGGPSRSADIEMTLSIGVHGPRALHVILI